MGRPPFLRWRGGAGSALAPAAQRAVFYREDRRHLKWQAASSSVLAAVCLVAGLTVAVLAFTSESESSAVILLIFAAPVAGLEVAWWLGKRAVADVRELLDLGPPPLRPGRHRSLRP